MRINCHDFVHTLNRPLEQIDLAALAREIAERGAEGRNLIEAAGVKLDGIDVLIELDMSYVGQTHTVGVPIRAGATLDVATVRAAFEASYRQAFGRLLEGIGLRVLTLRVAVVGRRPKLDLAILRPAGGTLDAARREARRVWFGVAWHDTSVFDRLALPEGAVVPGPAILEQPDATTVVDPDLVARVDALGNLILERKK